MKFVDFKTLHSNVNMKLIADSYLKRKHDAKKVMMQEYSIKSNSELKRNLKSVNLNKNDFLYTNVGHFSTSVSRLGHH